MGRRKGKEREGGRGKRVEEREEEKGKGREVRSHFSFSKVGAYGARRTAGTPRWQKTCGPEEHCLVLASSAEGKVITVLALSSMSLYHSVL